MKSPSKKKILEARHQAGLTQMAAGILVHRSAKAWQAWEYGINPMPPGLWELFLIKTGQMPGLTEHQPGHVVVTFTVLEWETLVEGVGLAFSTFNVLHELYDGNKRKFAILQRAWKKLSKRY